MADHINFSVHLTPIEEITDEQSNTIKILSGEVNTSLGASGESIGLANYSGALNEQGYKDGAVGYLDCVHTADGVRLTQRNDGDFFFIRNTGFKFSSTTVLGASTTDCIIVAFRIGAQGGGSGGWQKASSASLIHYVEIAWLKPGQAIVLPAAGNNLSISSFGSNANDLTSLNDSSGFDLESVLLYVKTLQSNGSLATDGNALEFLSVD